MRKNIYQFHVHTKYSPDSDLSIDKLYRELKKRKVTGIAITDHNTIGGAVEFQKKYGDKIYTVIGEEIMTSGGEIIGLFLKKEIPMSLTPCETIIEIKKQNGLVYIPHPFDQKRYKTCLKYQHIIRNAKDIDMIEVFNGRTVNDADNRKALELSEKLNKMVIYGSDAHSSYELKFNNSTFNGVITRDNMMEELKSIKILNKRTNRLIHKYTIYIKIKKMLKAGKLDEAFSFIYNGCKKRLHKTCQKD